jgi:hypothetical protein
MQSLYKSARIILFMVGCPNLIALKRYILPGICKNIYFIFSSLLLLSETFSCKRRGCDIAKRKEKLVLFENIL